MSNASDDLPDPDKPVITVNLSRGMVKLIFFRLWVLAPRISIVSIFLLTLLAIAQVSHSQIYLQEILYKKTVNVLQTKSAAK